MEDGGWRGISWRAVAYFLEVRSDIVMELGGHGMSFRFAGFETMTILLDVSGGCKFGYDNSRVGELLLFGR